MPSPRGERVRAFILYAPRLLSRPATMTASPEPRPNRTCFPACHHAVRTPIDSRSVHSALVLAFIRPRSRVPSPSPASNALASASSRGKPGSARRRAGCTLRARTLSPGIPRLARDRGGALGLPQHQRRASSAGTSSTLRWRRHCAGFRAAEHRHACSCRDTNPATARGPLAGTIRIDAAVRLPA